MRCPTKLTSPGWGAWSPNNCQVGLAPLLVVFNSPTAGPPERELLNWPVPTQRVFPPGSFGSKARHPMERDGALSVKGTHWMPPARLTPPCIIVTSKLVERQTPPLTEPANRSKTFDCPCRLPITVCIAPVIDPWGMMEGAGPWDVHAGLPNSLTFVSS